MSMTPNGAKRFGLDRETEACRKANRPDQPQLVFRKTPVGLAYSSNYASFQIGLPTHKIQHFAGFRPHEQAVDREVSPLHVLFRRFGVHDLIRAPTVGIVAVGTKGRDFDFESIARYENHSKLSANGHAIGKESHPRVG